MKKSLLPVLALLFSVQMFAQKAPKKYPSLLWEITGNGLTKPSYLFGTMHVSSKMVFHLPDSFYIAIGKVDMVALETDPLTWQDDLFKYDLGYGDLSQGRYSGLANASGPSDYLALSSFKFTKYEDNIRPALFFQPSIINSLLYRTQSGMSADFEENTYLDMYIYQTGKKMKKKTGGLENYRESMQLMLEAYYDASKEKNQKEKSYDYDEEYGPGNLQEAYRTGNLDKLDSINRLNSSSDAFDEKFLYRRNEIQANSIDSIIKSKTLSLFSGVGAAHLPGTRGVIELLRKKGYKLRPIMMGERDGKQKDIVDKIRVPVVFNKQSSPDSFYSVETPGKLFDLGDELISGFSQYSDMANGSYYMVSRVKTNAVIWGHSTDEVLKKVDSLLYENIPGKILSKTPIVKSGYKGFDITNRTRRGDYQRYNIFVTPYEVIVFKMSGNNEYVKEGEEAKRFFGSIQLKEYRPEPSGWVKFQPPSGGFTVSMPHTPQFFNTGNDIEFVSEDKTTNTGFYIARKDIHNYQFAEEDTFDLALIEESFAASEFVEKQLSRKQLVWKGYPALDCKYLNKDGSVTVARLLIQGPHYYALVTHGKKETPAMQTFLSSFEIKPFVYGKPFERSDTSLLYKVNTVYYPVSKKIKLKVPYAGKDEDDDDEDSYSSYYFDPSSFQQDVISNDTTGEKIFVSFYKMPEYTYIKDTSDWNKFEGEDDSTWIYRTKKQYVAKNGYRVWEQQMTDTNSSRMIWIKSMLKNGVIYRLVTETDTLTAPSPFLLNYFTSFEPSDTIKGIDPFTKKSALFFSNYFSADTAVRKKAMRSIGNVDMDSTDFSNIKKALNELNWSTKKYLDYKEAFIGKLGDVKTPAAADILKDIYYTAGDTIRLQYAALGALLAHKNDYAYKLFRDIVTNDPPVLNASSGNDYAYNVNRRYSISSNYRYSGASSYDDDFFSGLSDSLKLTRKIFPDLLPLLNVEDYEEPVVGLLLQMIDSNMVTAKDYEQYFSKFFLEAKQELKKQAIAEKSKSIQKATAKKPEAIDEDDYSSGNDDLEQYARLLLPFADTKPNVKPLLDQMLNSTDPALQFNIVNLLLKNKKPVPDSVLNAVAARDKYRADLYDIMRENKVLNKFPAKWNNPLDMAKSKMVGGHEYSSKPDTFIFIDKKPVVYKNKNAVVYFFKYKEKKDDAGWKIATVGLMPADGKEYAFYHTDKSGEEIKDYDFDISEKTSTKIKEDEPLEEQLQKELKKQLFSKRNSAKEFYSERNYRYGNYFDE